MDVAWDQRTNGSHASGKRNRTVLAQVFTTTSLFIGTKMRIVLSERTDPRDYFVWVI
jgi:hypothetical protein